MFCIVGQQIRKMLFKVRNRKQQLLSSMDSRKDGNIFEDWLLNFSGLDPHVIRLRLQFSKILHGL